MKTLELNQMESLQGGLSNRDCMVRGAGVVFSALSGLWSVTAVILATSGDCYN